MHQFVRAISPGLQEYIEAVSFYLFIKEDRLLLLDELSSRLTFPEKQDQTSSKQDQTSSKDTVCIPQPLA